MKIHSLETENFRVTGQPGAYTIKATTPLARAYMRLKKLANPLPSYQENGGELLSQLSQLEAGVAKLADI